MYIPPPQKQEKIFFFLICASVTSNMWYLISLPNHYPWEFFLKRNACHYCMCLLRLTLILIYILCCLKC